MERRFLLAFIAAGAVATSGRAQRSPQPADPATVAAVHRLLELTHAPQLAVQTMEAMLPAQRASNPRIPGVFWDAFLAHARRDVGMFADSLTAICAAHFTKKEVDELIRFYETPTGRRLAGLQPQITQESMMMGQRWGAEIGRQVAESLSQAGVQLGEPR